MKNRLFQTVTRLALLLVLAVAGLPVAAQELPEAIRKIQSQDYDGARTTLTALLDKSRKPEYYYWLGRSYLDQAEQDEDPAESAKLYEKAREQFAAGIERSGKFALNYAGLGRYYALTNKPNEAKTNLSKAEELEGSNPEVLIQLADSWRLLKTKEGRDRATTLLAKAETMSQGSAELYLSQGQLWFEQGVEDLPLTYYDKALAIDAQNAEAHYLKGQYLVKYKRYNDAAPEFKKALEINPKFAPALQAMGELYYLAKQYGIARDYYQQYLNLREQDGTKDASARYRYAQFLYLSKNYQDAVAEIEKVEKQINSKVLLRIKAYALYELGRIAEAKAVLNQYFSSIDPKFTIARDYEYRGKIAMKEGNIDAGAKDILKAIEMDETLTYLYEDLRNLYVEAKLYEKAIDIQRTALQADPSINNYYALGKLHILQYSKLKNECVEKDKNCKPHKVPAILAQLQKADSAYKKVVELRPTFLPGWMEVARTNALMDPETEIGLAKPHYEKIIELAAGDEVKYKKELVEAHYYLAYYYFNVAKDNTKALQETATVLRLDPNFESAKTLNEYLVKTLQATGGTVPTNGGKK